MQGVKTRYSRRTSRINFLGTFGWSNHNVDLTDDEEFKLFLEEGKRVVNPLQV